MDYDPHSMTSMVVTCERRQCVNITIVDDTVVESLESFAVTLENNYTWVAIYPADGEVKITDNDGGLIIGSHYIVNASERHTATY